MPHRGWDKWSKHKVLCKDSDVKSVLPATRRMTEQAFATLLDRYGKVVAKPLQKWGGQGILFISKAGPGEYLVQSDRYQKSFADKNALWRYVNRKKASPHYIVQKYIPLARVKGRPFDIRVMVQRKKNGPWVVTGTLVKIAGAGWQVTNALRSHGTVVPLSRALELSSALLFESKDRIHEELHTASLRIAGRLSSAYPGLRTIGLDMGLDKNGKLWFIEANFTPMLSLFRKLKDKTLYSKMISYQKE